MNAYYGNYLGIVIQNNDPEQRGRIKVFVPHISATLYDEWNSPVPTDDGESTEILDKNFRFPDIDTNPDLTKIMGTLRDILPWAECAAPLFGGDASGRYNAYKQKGTTSDSNYWTDTTMASGNRPLQNYVGDTLTGDMSGTNVYPDAFTQTGGNKNRFVNPYGDQYKPSNYSNLSRGMFTIPNVGANVWVFFIDGNPNAPVYFASSHGQEDWKRIYSTDQKAGEDFTSVDYPAAYQNKDKSETTLEEAKTFRAKTVFNSNKHSLEYIDTDNHEILKMTHFSGSFKEFTNFANIELATGQDQKMVLDDQFLTVQKNQSIYVAQHQEIITGGDRYLTVGKATLNTVQQIVNKLKQIHRYKLLFDVRRTNGEPINAVSKGLQRQEAVGGKGFIVCPVCGGNTTWSPYNNNMWNMQKGTYPETRVWEDNLVPENANWNKTHQMNLDTLSNGITITFDDLVKNATPEEILELAEENMALANINGAGGATKGGIVCDTCNGDIYSPSTEGGSWFNEITDPGGYKNPTTSDVKSLYGQINLHAEDIMKLERQLGEGDEIISVTKNKVENVGLVMNDMMSFRVDPEGKLRVRGLYVASEEVYNTMRASPLVEYVDVDDVPGGDYNLTVANKYKLLVGANGINIKTFGPIDMYGTIVNMAGEQISMSSQNEIIIDGGERLTLRGRRILLSPIEHEPVTVDGQLHVTRNAIINGGIHIEGEVGLMHVTSPFEYKESEKSSSMYTGIGGAPPPYQHSHSIPQHTHMYRMIPWTELETGKGGLPSKSAVRDHMRETGINNTKGALSLAPDPTTPAEGNQTLQEMWDNADLTTSNLIPVLAMATRDVSKTDLWTADADTKNDRFGPVNFGTASFVPNSPEYQPGVTTSTIYKNMVWKYTPLTFLGTPIGTFTTPIIWDVISAEFSAGQLNEVRVRVKRRGRPEKLFKRDGVNDWYEVI